MSNIDVLRRRRSLFVLSALPGLALSSWVTRTPEIRDAVQATTAEMGMILFGLSAGSMAGILLSGRIVRRTGTRTTILLGVGSGLVSLLAIALGADFGSQLLVASGLALFGFGIGLAEIALNLDGAEIERLLARPVLHTLHGCFSLGTLTGALSGLAFVALGLPIPAHLWAMAALSAVAVVTFCHGLPAGFGLRAAAPCCADMKAETVWKDPRILLIGAIVFSMALAEGAANDWLPILMVDEHGFSKTAGSLIFVAFAAAMTAGRLGGGWVIARYSTPGIMQGCAVLCAAGIGCLAFGSGPLIAAGGVLLWGLGASLGFPLAISAAGAGDGDAQRRVEAVAIIGFIAMLIGPPGLGFAGELWGLRGAIAVVMGFVALAALLAAVLGRRPQR